MKSEESLKENVRRRYAQIAEQDKTANAASCCGATPTSNKVYHIMMDDYTGTAGYQKEADLGLGCGLPTQFAQIKEGDTVIDLGAGAGNDCFVARHETGASGKVIGIDFTPAMISKARLQAEKLGLNNVEFRQGDIDAMPVHDQVADVVVSNCVLNLVPNKAKVMAEIFRVLKPGGHFSISDIVLVGQLPTALRNDAEMYAGCVAGALQRTEYLAQLENAGFTALTVQKEKPITLPEDLLTKYLRAQETQQFLKGHTGIFSITVWGQKPGVPEEKVARPAKAKAETNPACTPGSNCC